MSRMVQHADLSHQQIRSHRGIANIAVESRGFVSSVESPDIGSQTVEQEAKMFSLKRDTLVR